jgi:hypothetical protein
MEMNNKTSTVIVCIVFISLSILAGCVAPREIYRGYSEIDLREEELCTLDITQAYDVIIDDMHYVNSGKYGTVKLAAGPHKIKWVGNFVVSVLVEPSGHAIFNVISDVNLEAGHDYKLLMDRTTGRGYKVYFWIEDTTTGERVWGRKKP